MIFTQTKTVIQHVPISAIPNFVLVEIWETKYTKLDELNSKSEIVKKGETYINMSLVSTLREIELEATTIKYFKDPNKDYINANDERHVRKVLKTKKVFSITAVSGSNLGFSGCIVFKEEKKRKTK